MPKPRVNVGPYKSVFRGEIFHVEQATAVFPSGKKTTFERVTRTPSVTILAIDARGRLLLTREYRHAFKRVVWFLPAGRFEPNETPRAAAQRELREETGLRAKQLKLLYLSNRSQTLSWKRYYYIATGLSPAPLSGDEDEDITVVPTSIAKAFRMATDGTIENEGIAYAIIQLYRHLRKLK